MFVLCGKGIDVDKLVLSNCYRLVNVCVRQWQGNPYVSLSGDATVSAIIDNITQRDWKHAK